LSAAVSIVLSAIAILFARDVDRRSMDVSNQTIRSLETIRTTVQRLSDDTGGLIKVAWERMLGTVATPAPSDTVVQGLVSGLLAEFREDLDELAPGTGVDRLTREMGERVRRTSRRSDEHRAAPRSWAFNAAVDAIQSLSLFPIELLRVLETGTHLTRGQYRQLRKEEDIALALDELRDRDLLVPLQHRGPQGEETVYALAPWFRDVVGPALVFTGHETPTTEADRVASALRAVGVRPGADAAAG
jgi:hypothetical protein